MKKCLCNNSFRLKDIYIKIVLFNETLECDKCGRKFKSTLFSNLITLFVVLLPLFSLNLLLGSIGFAINIIINVLEFFFLAFISIPLIKLKEVK